MSGFGLPQLTDSPSQQDERQTRLELVEYQTTLPGASAGLSFEFCTDLFTGLTQLIEKKEKALRRFLSCF
ncbi:MAG: hypothetical protein ACLSA6_00575 [Holdemania massiliensis]